LHVTGPADGIPILFYHGVGGAAWSWEPQVRELSAGLRAYVWEARGHGMARAVADAGLGDYFADAGEALDAVRAAGRPPVVVGHSMGGLLALAVAASRPADVRGLVLVDPVYAPDGGTHAGGLLARVARAVMAPLVGSLERDGVVARILARRVFEGAFVDRRTMERAWRSQRTQVPVEYPKMMYEAFDGPTGFPNRAFASELEMPTLLIEPVRGSPRFPRLVSELRRLGDAFAHLTLDGGHYLQLDRSAAGVTSAIEEFVDRWSR
jgi:pimeloyl-ACP methyl ester carboxylesterase